MKEAFIKIHPKDAVAVATQDAAKGTEVSIDGAKIVLRQDIPFGHKVALRDMAEGEAVIKYGAVIGHTTRPIQAGDWVHMHNMDTNLSGQLSYTYTPQTHEPSPRIAGRGDTFPGRCDGIYAFPHNAGCSQMGDDFRNTQNILKSIVQHPNAGGVLIVSLGCENNDLEHFLPVLGEFDPSRIKTLITQDVEDEVETAMGLIGQILDAMASDHRESCPVSDLTVAFKCGGSDAFSGITANPLCGRIADTICAKGGSAVLTEVPEMFGAETYLMNRADSATTFSKVVALINGFKQYYADYGQLRNKLLFHFLCLTVNFFQVAIQRVLHKHDGIKCLTMLPQIVETQHSPTAHLGAFRGNKVGEQVVADLGVGDGHMGTSFLKMPIL